MMARYTAALVASLAMTLPLSARNAEGFAPPQQTSVTSGTATDFPQFVPAADRTNDRLDWQHWDEALRWMVIPMGPSIRQGAARVDPATGTRRIFGHESRLRLEGNRVAFSFLTPEIIAALGEYRADLERIGSELDVAKLPRNEQLSFWLNLHNVAVIEALAKAYPLPEPKARTFGPERASLDDAKLVTIAGVPLSPRDIREKIVYPNWRDPKVIYGFWRGEIGGPSIQRLAYTGSNVDQLLALSGEEFVNSLRGVEEWGGVVRVSRIYEEAAQFYFKNDAALRSHIGKYAGEDVAELLRNHDRIAFNSYETDLADLSRGERDPSHGFVCKLSDKLAQPGAPIDPINCATTLTVVDPSITRLMEERDAKLYRAWKKGIRTGTVIYADGRYSPDTPVPEVE
jgi:hypothetical protein